MNGPDSLQRFIFEHASIRGEIAHLKDSYQTIMKQREYPPFIKYLLGEALVSCLLLRIKRLTKCDRAFQPIWLFPSDVDFM